MLMLLEQLENCDKHFKLEGTNRIGTRQGSAMPGAHGYLTAGPCTPPSPHFFAALTMLKYQQASLLHD